MPESSPDTAASGSLDRSRHRNVLATHQTLVIGRDNKPMAFPLTMFNAEKTASAMALDRIDVVEWSDDYLLRGDYEPFRLPLVMRLKDYRQDISLGMPVALNHYNLFIRDEGMCQYGGQQVSWGHPDRRYRATMDHVVPKSHGGELAWDNVVLASASENERKADRTPQKARMKLRYQPWVPTAGDMLGLWATQEALKDVPEAWRFFLDSVEPTVRVRRIREGRLYAFAA